MQLRHLLSEVVILERFFNNLLCCVHVLADGVEILQVQQVRNEDGEFEAGENHGDKAEDHAAQVHRNTATAATHLVSFTSENDECRIQTIEQSSKSKNKSVGFSFGFSGFEQNLKMFQHRCLIKRQQHVY